MGIGKKSKRQVDAIRQTVFDRDDGCVVVGSSWGRLVACGGGMTVQHRVARGMGSSAKYDSAEFLLTMCAVHNQLETASAEFRSLCERNGWSMPRWVPARYAVHQVPARYPDGWYFLNSTGQRVAISDRFAVALIDDIYV